MRPRSGRAASPVGAALHAARPGALRDHEPVIPSATPVRQWAEWAPGARLAVPVIVLLVVLANLVGVATVTLLLLGVDDGSSAGRTPVLLAAAGYLLVAVPAGALLGVRRQRSTNSWLGAGRTPTVPEARRALRLPVEAGAGAGVTWLGGAVLVAAVGAAAFPDPRV